MGAILLIQSLFGILLLERKESLAQTLSLLID